MPDTHRYRREIVVDDPGWVDQANVMLVAIPLRSIDADDVVSQLRGG
jgi:hypothetical protein